MYAKDVHIIRTVIGHLKNYGWQLPMQGLAIGVFCSSGNGIVGTDIG